MAEKTFSNIRLGLKVDTLQNWKDSSLVLKRGELAFATVAASEGTGLTEPVIMVKIGDGEKTFSQLGFDFYAKASDVLAACKSEAALTAFVENVVAGKKLATAEALAELAGKVTTAEGKITTLEGEMDAVEGKAAANEAAITALQGLVGDQKVADRITAAIEALKLSETYAAKSLEQTVADHKADTVAHVTAEDKVTWNNALQASDIAKGSANGTISVKGTDVVVAGLGSAAYTEASAYEVAGAAATAEANAKAYAKEYADGLAGNYDEKGAAATAESNAKAYAKEYADGLAGNYDAAGSADKALEDAKKYTDDEIAELDLANTYAAKEHKHVKADITDFAHNHAMGEINGLSDEFAKYQLAGDYATKEEAKGYADAKDEAIEAAQAAADKAQEEVDALEELVGTLPADAGVETVVAYVDKKTAGVAANSDLEALAGRVDVAEGKISTLEGAVGNAEGGLVKDVADLKGLVGTEAVATQIENAVKAEKERAEGIEGGLETRLKAVEDDYLTSVEEKALQDQITANAEAIELLTNGVSAEEVDGVNDLIQYVKDHGTEVTGIKADIKANADAIDAIEADYLKAADKTELSDGITALDGRMTTVEGAVATKAEQEALNTLAGRVTTVENDLNTAETGLKARMTTAEADIDALEAKIGEDTVEDQIAAAIEALKMGDYAKAADLSAAIERIAQNESDIDALETEVAKKANDSDLAAIAKSGNVNDLVQTAGDVIIFDCGTSAL